VVECEEKKTLNTDELHLIQLRTSRAWNVDETVTFHKRVFVAWRGVIPSLQHRKRRIYAVTLFSILLDPPLGLLEPILPTSMINDRLSRLFLSMDRERGFQPQSFTTRQTRSPYGIPSRPGWGVINGFNGVVLSLTVY